MSYKNLTEYELACLDACATLNDPVEDIVSLVKVARLSLAYIENPYALNRLESTLSKFEGVK